MPPFVKICALVLAGGLSRRMGGGDKPLLPLAGRPMLDHILARLAPQTAAIAISAGGDPARFAPRPHPVLPDSIPDFPGPLAGVLAGLDWMAEAHPDTRWLLTIPGDTPFPPPDLAARLTQAREAARTPIACAVTDHADGSTRRHPVTALWSVELREPLRAAILRGEARVGRWAGEQGCAEAHWPDTPLDPFLNVNTPEDLARAKALSPAYCRDNPGTTR
ncbi:molybdenum cofactor guanylyltransferase MobA [Acetobacteraceae bacterium H6797]|nr:molybdenum cofactor guanylyltransferase MobA [Acetobacteraceae bacterium H6797]